MAWAGTEILLGDDVYKTLPSEAVVFTKVSRFKVLWNFGGRKDDNLSKK